MPQETRRREGASGPIYLGTVKITGRQFQQLQQQIHAGNRQEAVKLIRAWTGLRVEEALHIADNFFSIDFRTPQYDAGSSYLPPEPDADFPSCAEPEKTADIAQKVGKGIGCAAFIGGYGIFYILSQLVRRYLGKRK